MQSLQKTCAHKQKSILQRRDPYISINAPTGENNDTSNMRGTATLTNLHSVDGD